MRPPGGWGVPIKYHLPTSCRSATVGETTRSSSVFFLSLFLRTARRYSATGTLRSEVAIHASLRDVHTVYCHTVVSFSFLILSVPPWHTTIGGSRFPFSSTAAADNPTVVISRIRCSKRLRHGKVPATAYTCSRGYNFLSSFFPVIAGRSGKRPKQRRFPGSAIQYTPASRL